jgi:hypothetical protein
MPHARKRTKGPMRKKRDKEEVDRIDATYNALYNNLDQLPIDDVRRALADAGVDRTALRERLHMRAKAVAQAGRAEGRSASPALARLLEQTGDPTALPTDPKRALDKAKRYLADVFDIGNARAQPQVVGAFRGEGDLSDRDQETIDEIDAELRARADTADKDEPEKT